MWAGAGMSPEPTPKGHPTPLHIWASSCPLSDFRASRSYPLWKVRRLWARKRKGALEESGGGRALPYLWVPEQVILPL